MFMGQHLAEPSNAAREGQDGADGAHGNACQQTGKEQSNAEGQNDSPRRGSRQFDSCRRAGSLWVYILFHRPANFIVLLSTRP
jgi:hypothetical protein